MSTKTELRSAVDLARQEEAEARALIEALEQRVLSGDPDVSAAQMRESRDLAKFAALRLKAATQRAEDAESAEYAAAIEALTEEAKRLTKQNNHAAREALLRAFGADVTAAFQKLTAAYGALTAESTDFIARCEAAGVPVVASSERTQTPSVVYYGQGTARFFFDGDEGFFGALPTDPKSNVKEAIRIATEALNVVTR